MPEVGERFRQPGSTVQLEWTGEVWTLVCPADGVAVDARDDGGRLICPVCLRKPKEFFAPQQ